MGDLVKIPELRFPEFKGEWNAKKIAGITDKVNSGKTPLGGESIYTDAGILFIRSQNVINDRLSLDNVTYIPEDVNATMKNSVVQANDILLNITGASLGRSCVVPSDFKTGNVNQHVCIIRLKTGNNPRFIQPIFASRKGQNLFLSLQTGSGREGLNFQSIKQISLRLPSLPEQQKIAAFLSAVDDKIQQLTRKKALLEDYKKGVMQQIFSQQIRFRADDGFEFPEWKYIRGKHLFYSHSNKDHNGDLPILAATQDRGVVYRDSIGIEIQSSEASIKTYKIVEEGDFVISLRSFQGGIEYSDVMGICSPAYVILKPKVDISKPYFKYYFKKEDFIERLSKTVVGIRDGKQISYDAFSGLKLPFPCFEEQQKIADFLSALDTKINHVNTQLEQTKTFKKGLLQKMFV